MRALLLSLLLCSGCWDFASLSNRLGDLAGSKDLSGASQDSSTAGDGGNTGCAGFLCADFETPLLSPLSLTAGIGDSAIVVSTQAHGNTHSLQVMTEGGTSNQYAYLLLQSSPDAPIPSPLYISFWLKANMSVSANTLFVNVNPTMGATVASIGVGDDGDWELVVPLSPETAIPVEGSGWTCATVAVTSTKVTLTVGGAMSTQPISVNGISGVSIGIARGNNCSADMGGTCPTQLYIDDVVFNNSPLSCAP